MKQATFISELLILIIALMISAIADILPVVGRIAGKFAGRLYRNRHKVTALLKIAYGWLRWGRFGRIYTANYLADADPDFIKDFSVDNHCGTLHRHHACDRYRMALCIIRKLQRRLTRKLQRRLTALYRASYGVICQHLIAQSGIPVEIPDPAERNSRIRAIMANY